MRLKGIILAVIVILVSNAVALIGVALNRRGEPLEIIELTERELSLQRAEQDNSGVSLRLSWMGNFPPARTDPAGPIDRAKLEELGFDCPVPAGKPEETRHPLPRIVFVALEYEGGAWNQWLKAREEDQEKPERQKIRNRLENLKMATRLFVVDASTSLDQLRTKHPDPHRYLIVRGVVMAALDTTRDPREWRGYVSEILSGEIHVPLPFGSALSRLDPKRGEAPRYTVTLCYGAHLEPWIAAVKLQ